ncbi:MAG: hypothetical protein J5824_03795 [Lachnospiraceae bacterium]|nr:hypothetical protein [Lachnospiraceae bacterium]
MAFCQFCGKQLADGELCDCEGARKAAEAANAVQNAGDAVNEAAEAVNEAGETAADAVTNAEEDVKKTTSEFEKNMSEFAGKAKDVAGDLASKASEAAGAFTSKVGKAAGEISKSDNFKKLKPAICGAGILALVVILLCALFSGSYKKPIDSLVKEINKGRKTDYVSLINAGMPSDVKKLNKLYYGKVMADSTEDKDDDLKDNFEELEDECSKWKLVFKYDKKEKMTKRELEKFQDTYDPDDFEDLLDELDDIDELAEKYAKSLKADEGDVEEYFKAMVKYLKSFKKIKISKGYKVKGYYILKDGSEEVNKTNKVTLYVVKLNGDWVILGSKDGDTFSFDSDKDAYKETKFLRTYINSFFADRMMPGM